MPVDPVPVPLPTWALAAGAAAVVAAGAVWWVAAAPQAPPAASVVDRGAPAVVGDPAGGGPLPAEERVPEERGLFPATPGVLLETHETLVDDEAIRWDGAETGVTYLLRFICHGDGEVITVLRTSNGEEGIVHRCSPDVSTVEFAGVKGAPVQVVREGGEALVAVQIAVAP